jgi:hypothetical protein
MASQRPNSAIYPLPRGIYGKFANLTKLRKPGFSALEIAPKTRKTLFWALLGSFFAELAILVKRGNSSLQNPNFHFFQVSWKKI